MTHEMTLYLVRHATAAERGDEWPDDAKRPLTPEGMERFRDIAKGLAALDVTLAEVLTSPLVRARQTADILAAVVPGRPAVTELEALAPGVAPKTIVTELFKRNFTGPVALIGHEPGIGDLAAYLLGTRLAVPFKKGAICRIDVSGSAADPAATLRWFAPPRILRRIGG